MIDLSIIINGVSIMTDLFFKLKGTASKEEKVLIAVNKIITGGRNSIAAEISISNIGNKPFSIIDVFLEQKDHRTNAVNITDVNVRRFSEGGGDVTLGSDMIESGFSYKSDLDACKLIPFDFKAFLEPNQSETGWVIFPMGTKNLLVSTIGIKISGESEVFKH